MRRSVAGTAALLITVSVTSACTPGSTETTPTPSASRAVSPPLGASRSPTPAASSPQVPAGLPVMPGAVVDDPSGEPDLIAGWTVKAIGPDVYSYYLEELPAAGFAIDQRLPGGNVAVIRFTTPSGTALELTLVGESGGERTRIGLRVPGGP